MITAVLRERNSIKLNLSKIEKTGGPSQQAEVLLAFLFSLNFDYNKTERSVFWTLFRNVIVANFNSSFNPHLIFGRDDSF